MQKITLLIHCKDQKGIIAAVTNYIASIDGNIVYLDQHVDEDEDVFFMRIECEFKNPKNDLKALEADFEQQLAAPFEMTWQLFTQETKTKDGNFCLQIRSLFV